MVELSVEGGNLLCEVMGSHKFWAMKSNLEIPLEHIVGVTIRSEETKSWWHGWKILGTDIPGLFAAGVFRVGGEWVFWDVEHPENAIQIDLRDETYARLLMEVRHPEEAADLINRNIGKNSG
jgi:hypothetical protein